MILLNFKSNWLSFLFLFFLNDALFAVEKQIKPLSLKTTVIIPCHYKHQQYVADLLKSYSEQTVIPDEIVISFSECKKVSQDLIESITSVFYPFRLVVLAFENVLLAGANRNKCCACATGDIFICQDADDLPHPQRIEIIKKFFEIYKIDFLMHAWRSTIDQIPSFIKFEEISSFSTKNFNENLWSGKYANGAIAFRREIFDSIKYNN
jgi:glycosyltransferase involved in cell wall biosynthesis